MIVVCVLLLEILGLGVFGANDVTRIVAFASAVGAARVDPRGTCVAARLALLRVESCFCMCRVRGRSAVGGSTDSEGEGDDVMGGRDRESRFVGLF